MKYVVLTFLVSMVLASSAASATDCLLQSTGQLKRPGTIVFNSDYDVIQFCSNTGDWKASLGAKGPKGDAGPSGESLWNASGSDIYFSSGNVGVGTDLPLSTLHVLGTVTSTNFAGSGALLTTLNASQLASGTVGTARLGSGTANATTFLRGDGTWTTTPSGADNLGNHIATTALRSDTHNADDLGTTVIRWKDGWFAGTVAAATLSGAHTGSGNGLTALNAANLATGTVPTARLGSGTANTTTFLRGDGTWQTPTAPPGGITAVTTASATAETSVTVNCPATYFRTGCSTSSSDNTRERAAPNGAGCFCTNGQLGNDITCIAYCAK